MQSTAPALLVI